MPSLQNDGIYQDKPSMIDLSGMSCLSNMHASEVWNMSGLILCDLVFYVVYNIVYDVVYDVVTMSHTICWCYLWVLIPETMPDDVEGVASRLGPSVEQVPFTFDASKRAKITIGTPNNIIEQNIVELSCSLLVLILVRDQEFFRKIGANPLGQLSL
jgi:hypothetical protein